MPLGAPVAAVGTLGESLQGYVLKADGGGTWELGYIRGVRLLLGCRVHVEGTRCSFNGIACKRLWREGEPRPRLTFAGSDALGDWFGRLALIGFIFVQLLSLNSWIGIFMGE